MRTRLLNNRILKVFEIEFIVLSALVSFVIAFMPSWASVVVDVQLFLYLAIIALNFFRVRAFNLYQVWLASYIFIIWAEMCIIADSPSLSYSYVVPFIRYSIANACVLLGYHVYNKKRPPGGRHFIVNSRWFAFLLLLLTLYFLYKRIPLALSSFSGGRILGTTKGSGSIIKTLITAMGLLLPSLIAYYLKIVRKRSTLFCLIFVLPIFVVQLLLTTRYKFLFSVLPFLIITDVLNIRYKGKKHLLLLAMVLVAMAMVSTFVKNNRTLGLAQANESIFSAENESSSDRLTVRLASHMSPEGVVRMARMADRYFSDHSLRWGQETGFLLYFWFPRSLWHDKPTQLDYWLIREYIPTLPETYSSASGFIGELRADFGWGCLLFVFLFGLLLKRVDDFCVSVFSEGNASFDMVLASILYPWIFFFVRSPVTSTMSLLWEILIYYALYILFKRRS